MSHNIDKKRTQKVKDPHAHLTDKELAEELVRRAQSAIDGTAETVSREEVHTRAGMQIEKARKTRKVTG